MKSLSRRKRLGRASIVNHIALGQSKSCKNDKNKEYNKYIKKRKKPTEENTRIRNDWPVKIISESVNFFVFI